MIKADNVRDDYFEKYALRAETINAKDILQMYEDYKAGKLQKYYRSEKVPLNNNQPLKVLIYILFLGLFN